VAIAPVMARRYALDDSPEILPTAGGEDVTLCDIKITGNRATAKVTPTFEGDDPTVRYVGANDDWKLDAVPGG
jgi:hypothetical protein